MLRSKFHWDRIEKKKRKRLENCNCKFQKFLRANRNFSYSYLSLIHETASLKKYKELYKDAKRFIKNRCDITIQGRTTRRSKRKKKRKRKKETRGDPVPMDPNQKIAGTGRRKFGELGASIRCSPGEFGERPREEDLIECSIFPVEGKGRRGRWGSSDRINSLIAQPLSAGRRRHTTACCWERRQNFKVYRPMEPCHPPPLRAEERAKTRYAIRPPLLLAALSSASN